MPQGKHSDSRPRIAAIVLAAGSSRRMGSSKALLPIDGEPMVCRIVRAFAEAGVIDEIVVVTGYGAEAVSRTLESLPCRTVWNAAHASGGMLSSVKAGLSSIDDADAVFIALVDHPRVRPSTVVEIATRFRQGEASIVVPRFREKRGHPILLSKAACQMVFALHSDATLKDVTRQAAGVVELKVNDPAVVSDLDTPGDYQREIQKE